MPSHNDQDQDTSTCPATGGPHEPHPVDPECSECGAR